MPRRHPDRSPHRPRRGPDPWARPGKAPDGYAPRLVAAATARRARYGLVVDLTASLWGGDDAVGGMCPPRYKLLKAEAALGVETVDVITPKRARKIARAYDKGVESGSNPPDMEVIESPSGHWTTRVVHGQKDREKRQIASATPQAETAITARRAIAAVP